MLTVVRFPSSLNIRNFDLFLHFALFTSLHGQKKRAHWIFIRSQRTVYQKCIYELSAFHSLILCLFLFLFSYGWHCAVLSVFVLDRILFFSNDIWIFVLIRWQNYNRQRGIFVNANAQEWVEQRSLCTRALKRVENRIRK